MNSFNTLENNVKLVHIQDQRRDHKKLIAEFVQTYPESADSAAPVQSYKQCVLMKEEKSSEEAGFIVYVQPQFCIIANC